MKIIVRHILNEFLTIFFLCVVTLVSIYLIIDLFEKIDDLMENNATLSEGLRFFLYKIPFILYQIMPVATVLATLLSLGILSKNVEVTAMKAGGISIFKIIYPLIAASAAISVLSFIINEFIAPPAKRQAELIKRIRIEKKENLSSFKQNRLWYSSKERLYTIRHIDQRQGIIHGLTLYEIDSKFNITARVDAEEAKWLTGKWHVVKGIKRQFEDGLIKTSLIENETIPLQEGPDKLPGTEKLADEMSFSELRGYIKELKGDGYDATRYIVDLHGKIAFPFINIIMVIVAVPFTLKTGRHSGMAMGIGLSIIISFSYWIVYAVTTSIGYNGLLPPIIAAWSSNMIFGIIGILMFMNVRQ